MMHKLIDGILSYTHDIDTNERENRAMDARTSKIEKRGEER